MHCNKVATVPVRVVDIRLSGNLRKLKEYLVWTRHMEFEEDFFSKTKTKSKGLKGLQVEIGVWRAPILLVVNIQ